MKRGLHHEVLRWVNDHPGRLLVFVALITIAVFLTDHAAFRLLCVFTGIATLFDPFGYLVAAWRALGREWTAVADIPELEQVEALAGERVRTASEHLVHVFERFDEVTEASFARVALPRADDATPALCLVLRDRAPPSKPLRRAVDAVLARCFARRDRPVILTLDEPRHQAALARVVAPFWTVAAVARSDLRRVAAPPTDRAPRPVR